MWNPASFNTIKGIRSAACIVVSVWLLCQAAHLQGAEPTVSASGNAAEIVLQGKLFCSLKRTPVMPFKGTILSIPVHTGQTVKKGDILAEYRPAMEEVIKLRSRISPLKINELEMELEELDAKLGTLKNKETELNQLIQHKLAAEAALTQVKQELQLSDRRRTLLLESLRIQKRMRSEELALVESLLGKPLMKGEEIPETLFIVSPIDGVVIGIHPELQAGAEISLDAPAFSIGVLNPMIMKAQVHEIEAVRLSLGDRADLTAESLPGRRFVAVVNRISMTPLTPALEVPSYYEMEMTVANPEFALKDGLKGQVVFGKKNSGMGTDRPEPPAQPTDGRQ